ncbi:MAG TPA: DUF47 family protein [Acidimicrobiales bacterium]|nr:DUF47 family protein [Acidimicrobiales bacterium]
MRRRWATLSWLLPESPDLLGLLADQGRVTIEGAEAFDRWASGDAAEAQLVRTLEHSADDAKHAVVGALRQAFTTPLEPEDIFELSERLDAVLNQVKDLVREAEVLAMAPDEAMAEMSHLVLEGVRELAAAIPDLARAPDTATAAADRAIRQHRGIERVYRRAMSGLLEATELREVAGKRELYRRYARIGEAIEHVANRIWYAVVKQA